MAAQKRMFDRSIIETDKFLDLPDSGKALYFLLGMEADDEGFISPKRVMRLYQIADDNLKILIAKNFVIPLNSGVVVITDWKKNNWLDSRRTRPTEYQEELRQLTVSEESQYLLSSCLADARPVERSREENRIVESSIPFDSFWEIYPVKKGKKTAEAKWKRLANDTHLLILADVPNRKKDDGWQRGYIPHPTTYLNQERWNDEITPYKGTDRKKQITVLSANGQGLLE